MVELLVFCNNNNDNANVCLFTVVTINYLQQLLPYYLDSLVTTVSVFTVPYSTDISLSGQYVLYY